MDRSSSYRGGAPSGHGDGVDVATLYLCRQGSRWIVVLDSPEARGAARLGRASHDSFDARFELLTKIRRACPDVTIAATDGMLEGADYEWRLDLIDFGAFAGELGHALRRTLVAESLRHRASPGRTTRTACRRHRHIAPSVTGRPLSF